jgi:Family of unknown function (DUF5706)
MSAPIDPPLGAARLAYFTPVREYPPLADRKSSVLLAAYGLMVTVLLTSSMPIDSILTGPKVWASALLLAILTPLSILILLGAWYAFRALTRPIPAMPESLAFYPHIARNSAEEYSRRVKELDQVRAVEAMLHYNYSLATLCVEKFHLVERSITCARATFEMWVILLLMIVLLR